MTQFITLVFMTFGSYFGNPVESSLQGHNSQSGVHILEYHNQSNVGSGGWDDTSSDIGSGGWDDSGSAVGSGGWDDTSI